MKNIFTILGLMIMLTLPLAAQQYPPYIFLDGNGNPYPAGSGEALGSNPPYASCYTNVTGQVLPCNFGGSGPAFTYPLGTGIVTVTGGAAWGTTLAAPAGAIVGTTDAQLLTNKTATTPSPLDNSTKVGTTAYTDAAVAAAVAGVNPAVAVLAASTASLTGTYAQVGGGVGDTFTVTATGAFTLDGIAIDTIGQRVLLKDQSTASQNGVYTATVVGTTGVSPVFTRATDYDTPSDVNNTGAIPVQSGTANTTTSWLLSSQVTSIGSAGSSLTYARFSYAPTSLLLAANNLSDVSSAATARTNLGISIPVVAAAAGDVACAEAADTTIGAKTITAGSSTSSTITVTMAATPIYFQPGVLVVVTGATPSGFNVTSAAIVSTTGTTVTYTSTNNPGAWTSGGTIAMACANQTNDAIGATKFTFANNYSVPANSVTAGSTYRLTAQVAEFTSSAPPAQYFLLYYNTTLLYQPQAAPAWTGSALGYVGSLNWDVVGLSSTALSTTLQSLAGNWSSVSVAGGESGQSPTTVTTTSTVPIQIELQFVATGVVSATYVSGGTISGTGNCSVGTFNNSSTATGSIAVSSGTPGAITITSRGQSATAAPTTAVVTTGTATCSGTITITSVLGGSPGNAVQLTDLVERP